jgi:hypothetical protein
MDVTEASMTLRHPGPDEQSSTRLMKYHDELVARLRRNETEAVSAAAEAWARSGATAAGYGNSLAGIGPEQAAAAAVSAELAARHARYRMMALAEWRDAIREPLRRTREEMRSRGMLPPDLPPGFGLGENDAGWLSPGR